MYKQIPLAAEVLVTTGAIHTPVAHTVVAAPGAGKALRIIAISASLSDNATGLIELFQAGDAAGVIGIWTANIGSAVGGAGVVLPEPGIQLGINKAFVISSRGTVATQTIDLQALYFIDNVS